MLLKTGWQYLFKFTYANRFPLMLALPLKLPAHAFRLKPPTGPRGRSFDYGLKLVCRYAYLKNRAICLIFWGNWGYVPPRTIKTPTLRWFFPSQFTLDEQNFPIDQPPFKSNFEVLVTFIWSQFWSGFFITKTCRQVSAPRHQVLQYFIT